MFAANNYTMSGYNIFNYCSIALLLVIIVTTYVRKMTRGALNKVYLYFAYLILVMNISDIAYMHAHNSHFSLSPFWFNVIFSINIMFYFHISLYFCVFTVTLFGGWTKFDSKSRRIHCIPYFLQIIALALNLKFGFAYTTTSLSIHVRPLFFLVYAPSAIYLIFSMIYTIYNRKQLSKIQFVAYSIIFALIVSSVVIQAFFQNIRIDGFIFALCLMIALATIVRPENIIDTTTSLKKINAYADDMKRNFAMKRKLQILMLNIANYNTLRKIMGFDRANILSKDIADVLVDVCNSFRIDVDIYFLGSGKYRIIFYNDKDKRAVEVADRIRTRLLAGVGISVKNIDIIPCICITKCPEDIDDFASLMNFGTEFHKRIAYDNSVHLAKDIFDKKRYDILQNIDEIIDDALVNNKFEVYYQPIYSFKKSGFNSAEALIRLNTKEFGFIPPDLFIPCAEKSGSINKIGEYVLDKVCEFIKSDDFEKLGIDYIEVNLSVVQCMQKNLKDVVINIIENHNIEPSKINLEITETAASYDSKILVKNIEELVDSKITFSLDDYGTGYSNMERIASLPFSIIKLDKSFTSLKDNPKMNIILENTVKMLKSLGVHIVVEGVETEDVLIYFKNLNCDYIQGYYFSKPLPKRDFVDFIRSYQKQTVLS